MSNGPSSTSASGMSASGWRSHRQLAGERRRIGNERVRAQRHLARLVVIGHQRARLLGPELLPPQPGDPLRVGVLDGRPLGRLVARAVQQLGALARGAAQHRVDEAVPAACARLGELDRIRDDRVVGGAAQIQQLIQAESQRCQQRRIEASRRGRSASSSIR